MFQYELQTKSQNFIKTFLACIYLWTALNRTLLFSIFQLSLPKIIKKNNAQGLKNSNCIIENLPFYNERSSGWRPLPRRTNHIKDFLKRSLSMLLHLFLSRTCNTYICLFPMVK